MHWSTEIPQLSCVAAGILLAIAGLSKLLNHRESRSDLSRLLQHSWLAPLLTSRRVHFPSIAFAIPFLETILGLAAIATALLMFQTSLWYAVSLGLIMTVASFADLQARRVAAGNAEDCGCLGILSASQHASFRYIGALLALGTLTAWEPLATFPNSSATDVLLAIALVCTLVWGWVRITQLMIALTRRALPPSGNRQHSQPMGSRRVFIFRAMLLLLIGQFAMKSTPAGALGTAKRDIPSRLDVTPADASVLRDRLLNSVSLGHVRRMLSRRGLVDDRDNATFESMFSAQPTAFGRRWLVARITILDERRRQPVGLVKYYTNFTSDSVTVDEVALADVFDDERYYLARPDGGSFAQIPDRILQIRNRAIRRAEDAADVASTLRHDSFSPRARR